MFTDQFPLQFLTWLLCHKQLPEHPAFRDIGLFFWTSHYTTSLQFFILILFTENVSILPVLKILGQRTVKRHFVDRQTKIKHLIPAAIKQTHIILYF